MNSRVLHMMSGLKNEKLIFLITHGLIGKSNGLYSVEHSTVLSIFKIAL